MVSGPIVVIDDDEDDRAMLEDIFVELGTKNDRKYFSYCQGALDYLMSTSDYPFLIICDVNLPVMDGPELKRSINANPHLRKKAIPFIFLTTTARKEAVEEAYEMLVQGYFEKTNKHDQTKALIELVLKYWKVCVHPTEK